MLSSPLQNPGLSYPYLEGGSGGQAKEEGKEKETENNYKKKKNPSTEPGNLEYTVISAGQHTKAKREVPGQVSLRLNICLSLSKLINPLQF